MFIRTRYGQGVNHRLSVQHVLPVIRMSGVQHTRLQVQLGRGLHDCHFVDRVAGVRMVVLAGLAVRLAVEHHLLAVADTEQRIYMCYLFHPKIQTVIHMVAVLTGAGELILACLTIRHAVPCDCFRRTQEHDRVYRINVIGRQYQTAQRVAAETVGEHLVIYAGIRILRFVPGGACPFGNTAVHDSRIRLDRMKRQNDNRVVVAEMQRVAVDAALGQRLTAERQAAAYTQSVNYTCLYALAYDDAVDAVAPAQLRFIYFLVRTGFGDGHSFPLERIAALQYTFLQIQERRIDIHYVHINTVRTRISHTDCIIDNCITCNLQGPFV